MVVKRSTDESADSISNAGIVELYLDDVDELLSLARTRCDNVELHAGSAVLDRAEDLRSVLPRELSDVHIRTRNPMGKIHLNLTYCGPVFYDSTDTAKLCTVEIRSRLNAMGAQISTKARLRFLGKNGFNLLIASITAASIGAVSLISNMPGYIWFIIPAMAAIAAGAWLGNVGMSAAVIVTETRANARSRFAEAKVSRRGATFAGLVSTAVGALLGYVVAILTR